jgi:hypothetical protein
MKPISDQLLRSYLTLARRGEQTLVTYQSLVAIIEDLCARLGIDVGAAEGRDIRRITPAVREVCRWCGAPRPSDLRVACPRCRRRPRDGLTINSISA